MSDKIQLARQHVINIFAEMKSTDTDLCETVLIRDGQYCGHRFSNEDLSAVWFSEENEIKVYDQQRKLLRVESLGQSSTLRRAA